MVTGKRDWANVIKRTLSRCWIHSMKTEATSSIREFHQFLNTRETSITDIIVYSANNYQNGDSEEWLGEWMKSRGVRDEIVLATKYTSPFRTYTNKGIQANYVGNNMKSLRTSLNASLEKLQTDYVDLVRIKQPSIQVYIVNWMNSNNILLHIAICSLVGLQHFN